MAREIGICDETLSFQRRHESPKDANLSHRTFFFKQSKI